MGSLYFRDTPWWDGAGMGYNVCNRSPESVPFGTTYAEPELLAVRNVLTVNQPASILCGEEHLTSARDVQDVRTVGYLLLLFWLGKELSKIWNL